MFGKSYEEILDRAKKEGELRLWWEVPGERGVGEQFEAAFKKRFGFTPRVSLTPVTSPDSLTRFLTEVRVGRIDADLLYAGASDVAGRPERLALFEDIETPLVKIFSPKFKGVEGILKNVAPWKRPYSVDVTTLASGIVYNTKKTTPISCREPTRNLQKARGLPIRNGRATSRSTPSARRARSGIWRSRITGILRSKRKFCKRFSPTNRSSSAAAATCAWLWRWEKWRRRRVISAAPKDCSKEGYPIQTKLFEDVMTVGSIGLTIPKGAKSPNLALLYLAFVLEDGLPLVERINGEGTFIDPRSQLAKSAQIHAQGKNIGVDVRKRSSPAIGTSPGKLSRPSCLSSEMSLQKFALFW